MFIETLTIGTVLVALLTIVILYYALRLVAISRRMDREMEKSKSEFNQALDQMVRNYQIHCSMECADNNGCEKCGGEHEPIYW